MSQNAQIEGHVWYLAFKKTIEVFLTMTDTTNNFKTLKYFVYNEDHTTSHVFVQISFADLGMVKDEDVWKMVYYPRVIRDDSDIGFMSRPMVENNVLHLCHLV